MRQRIIIKRKSPEQFLREEISNFDEIVEGVVYDSDQFGVILKKDRTLNNETLNKIRSKLSKAFELKIENVPEEKTTKGV